MDMRSERIVLETKRYRIVGDVALPREGYRSRLSDYLNSSDVEFISIVDAEVTSLDGGDSERRSFIAVARAHVQLAYPYEAN